MYGFLELSVDVVGLHCQTSSTGPAASAFTSCSFLLSFSARLVVIGYMFYAYFWMTVVGEPSAGFGRLSWPSPVHPSHTLLAYDECAEWCDDRSKDLGFEIKTGKVNAADLSAAIAKESDSTNAFDLTWPKCPQNDISSQRPVFAPIACRWQYDTVERLEDWVGPARRFAAVAEVLWGHGYSLMTHSPLSALPSQEDRMVVILI